MKVYSNCPSVELSVNGTSMGARKRNSQDFPAAGLHWLVQFREGENELRAVGTKNGKGVADQIKFTYQTKTWGKPAQLVLEDVLIQEFGQGKTWKVIEARVLDKDGVLCLDARNVVRFGIIGDGQLLDNLGTSTGARKLELYNGRAQITVSYKDKAVVSVSSEGIKSAFLTL